MAAPEWIALTEDSFNLLLEDSTFLLLEGTDGPGRLNVTVALSSTLNVTPALSSTLTVSLG